MQAGAQMVKIEGGAHLSATIKTLVTGGIPVCAHIGLTPQSVNTLGGYKVQGRSDEHAQQMLDDGMRMREQGDLDASEELLTRLVEYCPDYAEGFNQRAFTRYIAQDFERAVPDLERTLELRPRHLGALSGKALTHSALNDLASAIPLLREMVRLHTWAPDRPRAESLGTDI